MMVCAVMKEQIYGKEDFYHYSYFKIPSRLAEKCLIVSDAMGYTASPDFRIDRKTFYNYLAFYVYEGTFYIRQYGRSYTLRAGQYGIMNLMDPHLYYSDPEDTAHLLWFHFRGAGVDPLIQMLKENGKLPYIIEDQNIIEDQRKLSERFFEVFALTKTSADETDVAGHLYGTIMEILKDYDFESQDDRGMPPELTDAAGYMDLHLGSGVTLEELSRNAGMGKYHFCHLFKKYYGVAPLQYFNSKKMEAACRMLKNTDDSIEVIAEKLGYMNSGHFRRMFKNYFGLPPSRYRAAAAQNEKG